MSKEFLVTLKVTVSDLPDAERQEAIDMEFDTGFYDTREEAEDAVPLVSALSEGELKSTLLGFFSNLADLEVQRELWAGTGEFLYVSALNPLLVSPSHGPLVSVSHRYEKATYTKPDGYDVEVKWYNDMSHHGGSPTGRFRNPILDDLTYKELPDGERFIYQSKGFPIPGEIPFDPVIEPTQKPAKSADYKDLEARILLHMITEGKPLTIDGVTYRMTPEGKMQVDYESQTITPAPRTKTVELETALAAMISALSATGSPISKDEKTGAVMVDFSKLRPEGPALNSTDTVAPVDTPTSTSADKPESRDADTVSSSTSSDDDKGSTSVSSGLSSEGSSTSSVSSDDSSSSWSSSSSSDSYDSGSSSSYDSGSSGGSDW